MPVTRSEGRGRKTVTEQKPTSSEDNAATSGTGISSGTGTEHTVTGSLATAFIDRTDTAATTVSSTPSLATKVTSHSATACMQAPSVTHSTETMLPANTVRKQSGGIPTTVTAARTEASTVKRIKKDASIGLLEPSKQHTLRPPSKKGEKGGSTQSKKAQKIAKAREELLRLKVELAAARLATLEVEDTDEEEEDVSMSEVNEKVSTWLENQQPQPLLAIANEHHRTAEEPEVLQNNREAAPHREEQHLQQQPPHSTPAGGRNDFTELATAITLAVKAAQRPKFIELPFFNGSYQEWLPFRAAYFETEEMFSKVENMNRLRRNLKGKAREAVENLLITNALPTEIMKALESRFGRPESIAMMEMEMLRGLPRLTESPRDICIFATKVSNCVATLKTLNCSKYMYNPEVSKTVVEKMTPTLRYRYYDFANTEPREDPDLQKIEKFLKREAELCGPYALPEQVTQQNSTVQKRPQKVHNIAERTHLQKCPVCEETGHTTTECEKFKNSDENSRWDLAKAKRLCFRCLRYRTKTHSCKAKSCGVNSCKYYHHKMLHYNRNTEKASAAKEDKEANEVINSTWTIEKKQTYLKIMPIQVKGPRGTVNTFALMDDGSTVTLIDNKVVKRIGATGPIDPLKIEAINDLKISETASKRVNITVKGLNGHEEQIQARTVRNLQVSSQQVSKELVMGCRHLTDIKDHLTYGKVKPQVLIGQDNWHLLLTEELRRGDGCQPVASRTPLGWVLHGSWAHNIGRNVDFVSHNTEESENENDLVKGYSKVDALCITPKKQTTEPKERTLYILEKTATKTTTEEPAGTEKICHVTENRKQKLSEGLPDVSRFSNWDRLRYTTARVLQFIQLCKPSNDSVYYRRTKMNREKDPSWKKTTDKPAPKQQSTVKRTSALKGKKLLPVSAEQLKLAEELLMRASQEDSFGEEINYLQNKKPICKESRLHQLSVAYVNGAIRLRSRIQAAEDLTEDFKSPMVLDGNHPTVKSWIQAVHKQLHHAGVEATVNECRQQYWVLRLRPVARTVLRQCLFCRMKTQAPPYPRTGDLPECRLAHHKRPFTSLITSGHCR